MNMDMEDCAKISKSLSYGILIREPREEAISQYNRPSICYTANHQYAPVNNHKHSKLATLPYAATNTHPPKPLASILSSTYESNLRSNPALHPEHHFYINFTTDMPRATLKPGLSLISSCS
jgi:hypothetical protein